MDPYGQYQPPPPPQPPSQPAAAPKKRGPIIILIAVITVAALVAGGAVVYWLLNRSDEGTSAIRPTRNPAKRTTPAPSPTDEPTIQPTDQPTDSPSPTAGIDPQLPGYMTWTLENEVWAFNYRIQFNGELGPSLNRYVSALDGLRFRTQSYGTEFSESELYFESLRQIYEGEIIHTSLWHSDKTWSQEIVTTSECQSDPYCMSPYDMTTSVTDTLKQLAQAAMDYSIPGETGTWSDQSVVGYTIEGDRLPWVLRNMGTTSVKLWIQPDLHLPYVVETTIDTDELEVAMYLNVDGWTWANTFFANGCMGPSDASSGGTCQTSTYIYWERGQNMEDRLTLLTPVEYVEVDPDFHQGD